MKTIVRSGIIASVITCTCSGVPLAGREPQTSTGSSKTPSAVGAQASTPDAKTLENRRKASENRRLFRTADPLGFTLVADFKAVNRDRNATSTKTFPAIIQWVKNDGRTASTPLRIRTRGHSRRAICDFAPLRLEFSKEDTKGTVFDGHGGLKLGTQCNDDQIVMREYAVYQIYNLLTPRSFRARLAKGTYIDAASRKTVATASAMFIEDDDDVAQRMGGRINELQKMPFQLVDTETITLMTVFEYMIGNTDMSLSLLRNLRVVQASDGVRYPVPYDFDYSGLVNAPYSVPDKQFGLASVRDRLYRGPCRTAAELEPTFAKLRAARPGIKTIYDTLSGVTPQYKREAVAYLDQFFRTIDSPATVKREFIDNCNHRAGM